MDEDLCLLVLSKLQEKWMKPPGVFGDVDLSEVILFEIFNALFLISHMDDMTTEELLKCLKMVNINISTSEAKRLMSEYDVNKDLTINSEEFSMLMVKEFCKTDLPKGIYVEKSTNEPWVILRKGIVNINIQYECDVPSRFDIGDDKGLDSIIQAMKDSKTMEQKEIIFKEAISSPYFYFNAFQAQILFDKGVNELNITKLEMVQKILPQMVTSEETVKFIDENLDDSEKLILRVTMGSLYNVFNGVFTGHYILDLSKDENTRGGRALAAISVSEMKLCKAMNVNTSQRGDFIPFRNEKLGGMLVALNSQWFMKCPNSGVIHFDYVSTTRPLIGVKPLSDTKFKRMLERLDIITIPAEFERLTDESYVTKRLRTAEKQKLLDIAADMKVKNDQKKRKKVGSFLVLPEIDDHSKSPGKRSNSHQGTNISIESMESFVHSMESDYETPEEKRENKGKSLKGMIKGMMVGSILTKSAIKTKHMKVPPIPKPVVSPLSNFMIKDITQNI
eukprot:CAMPEP_0119053686 /NCGR_PEP_ID=MMETSP1177-20130426/74579_1 /TAXON_ID=2985 /ORGANISM="Ochromonas sp, Strain CCMP1899" /LENGTH=504 /DNA_ID=CAMNT_0007033699 /DNA_START=1439 /DNA_END=2954 /DNA_ORIENTATION=+